MAQGGRGTHYIIGDDRSHLVSSKVIDALSKSFEPSISNCSITIEYGDYMDWQELGEIHENELISRQFFMPEADLGTFNFKFIYSDAFGYEK